MRIRYDPSVDAAYLELSAQGESRRVKFTYPCDPREVGGMINLDFDEEGRLVGLEIIDASAVLRPSVLDMVKEPGKRGGAVVVELAPEKPQILALFRKHGARGDVRRVILDRGDEAIFILSSEDLLRTRSAELTVALQELLGLKVWLTTDPSGSIGPTELL